MLGIVLSGIYPYSVSVADKPIDVALVKGHGHRLLQKFHRSPNFVGAAGSRDATACITEGTWFPPNMVSSEWLLVSTGDYQDAGDTL